MPFTLSHPAIVAFLPRRYFHIPALILGAMSPDFAYFIYKPREIGHTMFQSELINLPLVVLFYMIYFFILAKPLRDFLPRQFASQPPSFQMKSKIGGGIAFVLFAWLGMVSHIWLDSLTYIMADIPTFQQPIVGRPAYRLIKYGLSIIGLILMIYYFWRLAKQYPYHSPYSGKQKGGFWLIILGISALLFVFWSFADPMPFQYSARIIRSINCFLAALLIVCLGLKIKPAV